MDNENGIAPADMAAYPFAFRGKTGEFFRIWIVNVLLTFITVGLYSPWARVRARRYLYGNTFLDGANFDYHANPWSILAARLIVVAIFIGGIWLAGEDALKNAVYATVLGLFLPWAVVRGLAFNARYASYRGARFSFRKAYFRAYLLASPFIAMYVLPGYFVVIYGYSELTGEALGAQGIIGGIFFLAIFLILPQLIRAWFRFKAEGYSLGAVRFRFGRDGIAPYIGALWGSMLIVLSFVVLLGFVAGGAAAGTSEAALIGFFYGVIAFLAYLLGIALLAAQFLRLFWRRVEFSVGEEHGKITPTFGWGEFAFKILFVNYALTALSLGLLHPWAKIRRARFLAEHMRLEATPGALAAAPRLAGDEESALGGELDAVEGFDFDIGLV